METTATAPTTASGSTPKTVDADGGFSELSPPLPEVVVGPGVSVLVDSGVRVGVDSGMEVDVGVTIGVGSGVRVAIGVDVAVAVGVEVGIVVFVGVGSEGGAPSSSRASVSLEQPSQMPK